MLKNNLLVVLLALGWFKAYTVFFPWTPCDHDPKIPLQVGKKKFSWDACQLFHTEYTKARTKFQDVASEFPDSELHSLTIHKDEKDGEDLSMDIVILKGNQPGVLVHSSGTHGVEGYAGSAIQLAFLNYAPKKIDDRPTIILVHAVNPYGMKHYRRFNENNVDLNRNCLDNMEEFIKERDPNLAGYEDFRKLASPNQAPYPGMFLLTFVPALLQHGYEALKRVLVSGQYHHPEGVFYGGTQIQPSIKMLKKFFDVKGLLPKNPESPLVWIDVHTGLGESGKDTLLLDNNDMSHSELEGLFPTAVSIITPQIEDKKAMSGYDLTKGIMIDYFQKQHIGKVGDASLHITQEFGTLPGVLVGRSIILENAMHHHGTDADLGRYWMQSAFYPQSTEWRASIVQRGVSLLYQSIDYIQSHPPTTPLPDDAATITTSNENNNGGEPQEEQ